jgi:hypothetical protein
MRRRKFIALLGGGGWPAGCPCPVAGDAGDRVSNSRSADGDARVKCPNKAGVLQFAAPSFILATPY